MTLGHLITLLTKDDLTLIKDSVNSDHLQSQMKRVWDRLLPEKSTVLFDARTYIADFSSNLNTEEKTVLESLLYILKPGF